MTLIPDIKAAKASKAKSVSSKAPKSLARRWQWLHWFRQHRRAWKITGGVVVVLVLVAVYCGWQARTLYRESIWAKIAFEAVAEAVEAKDFSKAKQEMQSGTDHVTAARQASRRLWPIKWLPWVHTQFVVLDQLLLAGEQVGKAGQPLLGIVEQVNVASANQIGEAEREALLQTLYESPDVLINVQTSLRAAVAALKDLPTKGVAAPLQIVVETVQTNLPTVEAAVEKGLPFLTVAPAIAGYPDTKTYLFLLQNNTELRPTGGFIGTYGILKLRHGSIAEFKTDNIYNIDDRVKDTWPEVPPEPMQRYLGAKRWFLRDVNWDPDFPTTAAKAEEFYHGEMGDDQTIDGVIAVTPELIHDLLEVTGPITVSGDEYNAANLTEKLQYQVEIAFYQEGISVAGRKAVIGELAGEIMDRVMNLPQSSWDELATVLITNLEEKHILISAHEPVVRDLVGDIGWDGAIAKPAGDFLLVVDANLAAKKTDRVMTKTMDYSIRREGDDVVADLTLHYRNDGVFDDFTTRYRSYMRIYVPAGSELISSQGFLTNDRYLGGDPTTATTSQAPAVDKTVFEGFISVEPKSEEVISLRYRLPASVADALQQGQYQLLWQKQPGTDNVTANYSFDVDAKVASAGTLDETAEIDNTKVHFTAALLRDLQLTIELK